MNFESDSEILIESTVIFYQIRYVMNAMIKSINSTKYIVGVINVNVYLMIMSAKNQHESSSYKILI